MMEPSMSPGRSRPHWVNSAGLTLVELAVVVTIVLVLISAATTLTISAREAQDYAGRVNRVNEMAQGRTLGVKIGIRSIVHVLVRESFQQRL